MTVAQLSSRQRTAIKIGLTVLSIAAVYWTVRGREDLSWPAIAAAVRQFRIENAILVALLGAAQILFMILRMYALCPTRPVVPFKSVTFAVAVGHAANMFLPARAGEAMKILWLGRSGGKEEGYVARGAGWILADRVADLAGFLSMILFTGVLGLPEFKSVVPFSLWWVAAGAVAIAAIVGILSRVSQKFQNRLKTWTARLKEGLSALKNPTRFGLAWLAALAAWAVELAAMHILTKSLGYDIGISEIFFVLVVLNLAIAVPVSVANVGPFEASVAFALGLFKVPLAASVAIAGAHHLLQLFGIAGWALFALAWSRGKVSTPVTSGPSA